jgi:uncharacterized CHY-type Zn-finger protein
MKQKYKLICNKCKSSKSSEKPFSSDLKENNKRYILCGKCNEKIFFQFKLINKKSKKVPIFLDSIIIKKR